MLRLIVGAIGLALLAGCSQAQEVDVGQRALTSDSIRITGSNTEIRSLTKTYTIDSAKEARFETCLSSGFTAANCRCRTEASARILPKPEFLEETQYIEFGLTAALAEFRHRMMLEQPELMLRLGKALSECPSMSLKLE